MQTGDQKIDLLTLTHLPGIGPRHVRAIRARGLAGVLAEPEHYSELLPKSALRELRSGQARARAEKDLATAERLGDFIVCVTEPSYPAALREIYDPPAVLYVRGTWPLPVSAPRLAIVGSRSATPAATSLARRMAADLAAAGVLIVSGLARGIDAAAHRGAVEACGYTLAVLGSGLDRMYPAEHADLAMKIARRGAVVSEFPFGTAPLPGHFPRRNRIIAGCSQTVVVVEAAARSGALSTARQALDEGRDVLAVPGHPSSAQAVGTNQLIRDGARLVRHGQDIAEELGLDLSPAPHQRAETPGAPAARDLLACLRPDAPLGIEELQSRSGQELSQLLCELTQLELSHEIRRLPGSLFVRR
jgi:DNA processing protein